MKTARVSPGGFIANPIVEQSTLNRSYFAGSAAGAAGSGVVVVVVVEVALSLVFFVVFTTFAALTVILEATFLPSTVLHATDTFESALISPSAISFFPLIIFVLDSTLIVSSPFFVFTMIVLAIASTDTTVPMHASFFAFAALG